MLLSEPSLSDMTDIMSKEAEISGTCSLVRGLLSYEKPVLRKDVCDLAIGSVDFNS